MQLYQPSRLIFLWLIPVLVFLFLWGRARWHRRLSRLGNPIFLQNRLMPGLDPNKIKWTWAFMILVFLFSTISLARPQWGEEKKRIERKGLDVVFLLDTSLSMLADDVKPDRLRKSKLEIKNLIRHFKGHRVGMVAFAGSSFLQCPLTLDYSAFLLFVDALKPGYIPNPGTSLAQAIELGIHAFTEESRKYRALIIFSDGEDHEGGMNEAVELAKKAGVRIYTLGVGTPEGGPIPLRSEATQNTSAYKKDRDGQVVITRLNTSLLEQIAKETGGLYLPATAGEKEVDIILKHLETLGERKLKEQLIIQREERFQLFLFIAFLFLMGETLLGNRKKAAAKLLLPLLAFFVFTGFLDSPRSLVDKGNRNVEKKKYQSAVNDYRKAEVAKPNDPVVRYNLGTTFYQLYQYQDAQQELEQSLARVKDPATKAKALYNYGNTQYRLGDFEKAIDAYKKSLDLNPKDEDAKYNLEFLKKQKSVFEKKNQDKQQQKQNQEQQSDQGQQQNNQSQSQSKQQQQKGGQENQDPSQSEGQQGDKEQQSQGSGGQGEEKEGQQQNKDQQDQQQKPQDQQQNKDQQKGSENQKEEQKQKEQQEQEKENESQNQEPQQGQESQENQDQGEGGQNPQPQEPKEGSGSPQQQEGQQALQGQMSKENALRILDALKEGEKGLQDMRRPPLQQESEAKEREPLKDW